MSLFYTICSSSGGAAYHFNWPHFSLHINRYGVRLWTFCLYLSVLYTAYLCFTYFVLPLLWETSVREVPWDGRGLWAMQSLLQWSVSAHTCPTLLGWLTQGGGTHPPMPEACGLMIPVHNAAAMAASTEEPCLFSTSTPSEEQRPTSVTTAPWVKICTEEHAPHS